MRQRHVLQDARRDREFAAFVAGAAGRLLHAATLLTAEAPDDNPRARRLLTRSLAHTYAGWNRLRGDDPYDHARRQLALRFARGDRRGPGGLLRARPHPGSPLAALGPQERLVVVLRFLEGVAEEQTAALLGLSPDRVRALAARATETLLRRPSAPAPAVGSMRAVPS
ncbi:sigma factor-like helix-turn-helix DNA-binding protein [Streptomyces sp. enrichment culture]|uniref:sigma factor-like helix-turn-helix DNA-binding protein n=1 Tax=Streptomyces sp. enrichment culture TaxID=1795815 RepID=UPI003F56715B